VLAVVCLLAVSQEVARHSAQGISDGPRSIRFGRKTARQRARAQETIVERAGLLRARARSSTRPTSTGRCRREAGPRTQTAPIAFEDGHQLALPDRFDAFGPGCARDALERTRYKQKKPRALGLSYDQFRQRTAIRHGKTELGFPHGIFSKGLKTGTLSNKGIARRSTRR